MVKVQSLTHMSRISPFNIENKDPDARIVAKAHKIANPVIEDMRATTPNEEKDNAPKGLKDHPLEQATTSKYHTDKQNVNIYRNINWDTVKKIIDLIKGYLIPFQTTDSNYKIYLI